MRLAPGIASERGADLVLRFGLDDVDHAVLVTERAAEDDEPFLDEPVHERGMRGPAGLLLHGTRPIPLGARAVDHDMEHRHAGLLSARLLRSARHRYRRRVSTSSIVRIVLVAFVLAWILGPDGLRDTVPLLFVFAIAVGLEVQFLVGALRGGPRRVPDRSPQQIDRDRYGFDRDDTTDDEEEVVSEYRSPFRGFALGLAVLGALAVVAWFVESRSGWSSLDGDAKLAAVDRFSDEASRIAGKPVSVGCDEAHDYVGYVQHADGIAIVGGDRAYVTPEICFALYRLAFKGDERGSQTARAIAVVAHEAWHLRGESDEGTTECYALQSGVALGRRLGLDEGTARRLMAQQLTENMLRGLGSLEYRVSDECRDGGRLDLNPESAGFP